MKTRRRIIKTPSRGRRTSIICVKKSPLARKNLRRTKNSNKNTTKLPVYESPLRHFYHNSPGNLSAASVSTRKNENVKVEAIDEDSKKEKKNLKTESTSESYTSIMTQIKKQNHSVNNEQEIENKKVAETNVSSKGKKRSINKSADSKNIKRQKLNKKKSPLSKIIEPDESSKLSDSIIIVEDFDMKPLKSVLNESLEKIKTELAQSTSVLQQTCSQFAEAEKSIISVTESPLLTKPVASNEDIVVIDYNDSSLMEMEAFHEAVNEKSPPKQSVFTDSIIVIDHDDELPVEKRSITPKPTEDCFVVWSSLPKPCTSNSVLDKEPERPIVPLPKPYASISISDREPERPIVQPLNNNSEFLNMLKCDKILFDTNAQVSNLRLLNNENNKPSRRGLLKSPKATIKVTKTSKTAYKTGTLSKTATKTTKTTVRKKGKNSNELIFLSESKVEDETAVKKKKSVKGKLREIVIDGSNVAMAYTHNKIFSEKGIKMLIDYFTKKGHTVKVFIPQYRRSRNYPLLEKWYDEGIVVFTPSRKLGAKSITSYDDRYILEYATACNGIVVSQDQFRDLYTEKPEYRDTIENRLLVPTFVGDYVMFPEDPLGRDGPTLAEFLRH